MNFNGIFKELKFIVLSLSVQRIYHFSAAHLSHKLSLLLSKPIVMGLPYACSIEPTTRCNLRCPECPTGLDLIERKKGDLALAEFRNYLAAVSHHTWYLTLYLQGEPFLNNDLSQMIASATEKKIFTCISTNGHFLSEANAIAVIKAGLKKIIISLDGITQESYAQYRKNGNFEKVTEGIRNLVNARKLLNSENPIIVIQFIVFRHNQDEIAEIKKLGKALGADKVEIKTAQHYNLKKDNMLITSLKNYRRYKRTPNGNWELKHKARKGCKRLWTTLVVTWDGKIVACCYDKDATFAFGCLAENNLENIWKGVPFMDFRKTVLTKKMSVEICSNCGEK